METKNIKRTAKEKVSISKNELNQLLYWASVGVTMSRGGSYQETIVETIREFGGEKLFGREVKFK